MPENKRGLLDPGAANQMDTSTLIHANYFKLCMLLGRNPNKPLNSFRDDLGRLVFFLLGKNNETVKDLFGEMPKVAAAVTLGNMGSAQSERIGSTMNDVMGDLNRNMHQDAFRASVFIRQNRKLIKEMPARHPSIWSSGGPSTLGTPPPPPKRKGASSATNDNPNPQRPNTTTD